MLSNGACIHNYVLVINVGKGPIHREELKLKMNNAPFKFYDHSFRNCLYLSTYDLHNLKTNLKK